MDKKCIYCRDKISEENVVDFCEQCGKNVWGEKMYGAIIENMKKARDNGDLCHSKTLDEIPKQVIDA